MTLDLAQLRDITSNDDAVMREVLESLLLDVATHIHKLDDAMERSDISEAQRLAHSMKGACGNVGANTLAILFGRIELSAYAPDAHNRRTIDELNEELENLRRAAAAVGQDIHPSLAALALRLGVANAPEHATGETSHIPVVVQRQ